jgi:D-alanyl-D-alanine carboxypeptidase
VWIGAAALASGLAFGGSQAAAGESVAKADRALDRALGRLVRMRGGPPGVASIIDRGDHRELHRAGVRIVGTRHRIRVRDHMRIASVSKAFSGAVALSLVDRGRLSLDDTIEDRVPGLPASWGSVTLRELLNHTSGLPDYTADPAFRQALVAHPHRYFRPRELLAFVADQGPTDRGPTPTRTPTTSWSG